MRRSLSDLEVSLFAEALIWKKGYDDSNPDVGMGCFTNNMVDDIASSVGFELDNQQRKVIINVAENRSPYIMGRG